MERSGPAKKGSPARARKSQRIRRQAAIALVKEGVSFSGIALELDCSKTTVHRWWKAYKQKGPLSLYPKPMSGRPPRMSPNQGKILKALLHRKDRWKLIEVSDITTRRFQKKYHPSYLSRLLRRLGWRFRNSFWVRTPRA